MNVAICVATYRRPGLLAQSLRSLGELRFDASSPVHLSVVVVDNDRDRSASAVVEGVRGEVPWPIVYEVEPTQNISLARNRAVRSAIAGGAEMVAFIDDDETASPDWVRELLAVQREYHADVVAGPVIPAYGENAPEWIMRGGFFDRPRYSTGQELDVAETSNALVSVRILSMLDGPFDPAYGLGGGGDSHFFLRARQAGAKIVWADGALVSETIIETRATARWILQRAYREGNCGVLVHRAVYPVREWLPERLIKSGGRLLIGTVLLAPALLRGRAAAVQALRHVFAGSGSLAGILGFRYIEYRRIHGE